MQTAPFKNNHKTLSTDMKEKDNWFELRNNPWRLFRNYNAHFDNIISKISQLQSSYRMQMHSYNKALNKLEQATKNNEPENFKVQPVISYFALATIPTLIINFLVICTLHLTQEQDKNIAFFMLCAFGATTYVISSFIFYFLARKQQKNKNLKEINKQRESVESIERNIIEITKEYQKNVSQLISPNQYLDIREHLNHYYDTNIPELKAIVQDILNKHFPPKSVKHLSFDLDKDSKCFIGNAYISEIFTYINNIIEQKTASMIGSKILVASRNEDFTFVAEAPELKKHKSVNKNYDPDWDRF